MLHSHQHLIKDNSCILQLAFCLQIYEWYCKRLNSSVHSQAKKVSRSCMRCWYPIHLTCSQHKCNPENTGIQCEVFSPHNRCQFLFTQLTLIQPFWVIISSNSVFYSFTNTTQATEGLSCILSLTYHQHKKTSSEIQNPLLMLLLYLQMPSTESNNCQVQRPPTQAVSSVVQKKIRHHLNITVTSNTHHLIPSYLNSKGCWQAFVIVTVSFPHADKM